MDISTIDYYGHVTYMIFFAGCDFRCPFCQNGDIILPGSGELMSLDHIKEKIKESTPLIDAVGVSGGEPTLQPKPLYDLFRWAKRNGLETFLNTNASRPDVVEGLVKEGLVDFIALDVKGPLTDPARLSGIIGLPEKTASKMADNVRKTMEICLKNKVPTEVRTTVVPTLIDDEADIRAISRDMKKMGEFEAYYIQQFFPLDSVLEARFKAVEPPKRDALVKLGKVAVKEGIRNVYIKTKEHGVEKVG